MTTHAADARPIDALVAMRKARRVRRVGEMSWGDAAYQVYVTALFSLFGAYLASGWVGDSELGPSAVDRLLDDGPRWFGLGAAVALLIGVRSGRRGGPLALESADVSHLLLAPIDPGRVLRRPVLRMLGLAALIGTGLGALTGQLVSQRLPDGGFGWLASGGVAGGTAALLAVGSGLVTAGRRVPTWLMLGASWVLTLWAIGDLATDEVTAPSTYLGRIAVWPDRFEAPTVATIVLAVFVAVAAVVTIGGVSVEAARRRTALVGQLRFAVTQQDLRTVMLLRRQLAAEVPRGRPWIRVRAGWLHDRYPVFVRDLRSVVRWPALRIGRVLVLSIAVGLAMRGVWAGTTPLVLVAGVAAFVAALDAIEPLAQELDHPGRLQSVPIPEGHLMLAHLAAPVVVLTAVGVVGGGVAVLVDPSVRAMGLAGLSLIPAVGAAVASAAISVASEPTLDSATERLIPPEVAGPRILIKTVWPPAVATIGLLPGVFARRSEVAGDDAIAMLANVSAAVMVLVAIVFVWVRFRNDLHRSMSEAMGGSRS